MTSIDKIKQRSVEMDKKKLVKWMRVRMKRSCKIPDKERKPFYFCWSQATFDLLMDLDREFNLGAFYRDSQ